MSSSSSSSDGLQAASPDRPGPHMQWSKPVIADLRRERRGATFDVWEMTTAVYGGKKELAEVERQTRLVMAEPRLQADDLWWLARKDRYVRACERGEIFVKMVREHNIGFEERGPLEALLGEDLFILLHDVMFIPTLINLADDEQQKWWLGKAMNYEILGTYAQTELTHGSNVRGLHTRAEFDPTLYNGDGGWVVHTPSLEAMKWWPGGMAKSANCVILMARVVIKGKDFGPHPFFFQIRDFHTHASLPGIELRDIGQKMGYNGMDNGGLRVSHVKIPRRNLLMRYVSVSKDGEYKKLGDEKMLFGTMTYTRLKISSGCGVNLAKAVTTCVRYSAVRRQFQMIRTNPGKDLEALVDEQGQDNGAAPAVAQKQLALLIKPSKRSEAQVLDYVSQQYILFPQMALCFGLHFSAQKAIKLYKVLIEKFKGGDFSGLTEIHVLSSTLKAVSTVLMADGMEGCRKSLGGHGFLNSAGVGPQMLSALPQATYEGDFVVLSIQVGQQLLKAVSARMLKNKTKNPNTPLLQYIYDFDPSAKHKPPVPDQLPALFSDHKFLFDCLKRRANYIHYTGAEVFQKAVMAAGGKVDASALDAVKIEMMRMTFAHAYVIYAGYYLE